MSAKADRLLAALGLFSGNKWRWTVEEAADCLGLPASTTYRYFRSLAEADLISSHVPGTYILGPAVCELDRAMRLHDPFINAARDEMHRLATSYGDTIVLLARIYRGKVMCVHREGEGLTAIGYERGRPMPLERGAASKVILANLPPRQLRALSASNDTLGLASMDTALREIRNCGYSVTYGEVDPGKIGISVPVFRDRQVLEGSLSFVVNASRIVEQEALVEGLIRGRKAIEANLLIAQSKLA